MPLAPVIGAMNAQNNDIEILLLRYLESKDQLSATEMARIEEWFSQDPKHQDQFNELKLLWERAGKAAVFQELDVAAGWDEVWDKMQANPSKVVKMRKSRSYAGFLKIAATVAFLVTAGWLVWQLGFKRSADAPMMTHSAVDSVMYVSLPDGSQVTLNKNAMISYAPGFGEENRVIHLKGEGYFEVAHDPAVPFLIFMAQTTVRVVGTAFNVLEDKEGVKVTVSAGKVAFSHEQDTLFLTQDEVGQYSNTSLQAYTNHDLNYKAWKTGVLEFDETPLQQVIHDLQRHYNITITIQDPGLKDLTFSSTLDNQALEEVLEELHIVLDIQYSHQNDQVTFL
ncbi:MAG: DUF4974 domain-containing protein [Cytophagales bacterium]|nr:DUF4974 domain-containing protein [Cytophagales bacterium]